MKILTRLKKAFQEAFYPNKCLACGVFFHFSKDSAQPDPDPDYLQQACVEAVFEKEMSPFLCPACLSSFAPITPPYCSQCGEMFESPSTDIHQCGDCIQKNKHFQTARSAGIHGGAFMKTIHGFKYGGKIQLARPLGRLLFCAYLKYFDKESIDMVIPIPLHVSKLKHRGFNQAMMILKEWPQFAGRLCERSIAFDFCGDILNRKKKTESQTGLTKKERKSNVKNAFTVKDSSPIKKKGILLVDDVYTTGATSDECARVLLRAGAENVHVLTLARAV